MIFFTVQLFIFFALDEISQSHLLNLRMFSITSNDFPFLNYELRTELVWSLSFTSSSEYRPLLSSPNVMKQYGQGKVVVPFAIYWW